MKIKKSVRTDIIEKKSLRRVVRSMKAGRRTPFTYVIAISEDGHSLEIYYYDLLLQPALKSLRENMKVVGIALSKQGALDIMAALYQETLDQTGGLDAAAYLLRS